MYGKFIEVICTMCGCAFDKALRVVERERERGNTDFLCSRKCFDNKKMGEPRPRTEEYEDLLKCLYEKEYHSLHYFPMKMLRNSFQADDIVHDVILRLLVRPPKYNDAIHLKNIMYRAIRNITLQKMEAKDLLSFGEDVTGTPDESIINREIEQRVIQALRNEIQYLPPERRKVMTLFVEGKSTEQIMKTLDKTRNGINNAKARAIYALRNSPLKDFAHLIKPQV